MSYHSWKKRPPREFRGKPQWTLDEMYISPFTARRRYDEEGVMHYDAVERNTAPTGVEVMDHYLRRLSEGKDCHNEWSDIDVAVIVPKVDRDNWWDTAVSLGRATRNISSYIEPILLESGEDSPIYREVMRTSVAV